MKKTRQTEKTYLTSTGYTQKQYQGNSQLQIRSKLELNHNQNFPSTKSEIYSSYESLKKKNTQFKQHNLINLLNKISVRRKMYCFQVIKQFYLFPDQSISENIQLDSYDRLFVNDEPIHTFVKIYQTKEIENIIWAFLNLKAIRLKKKLQKFSAGITAVQQKAKIRHKKHFFSQIKTYSIKIKPTIQVRKTTVSPSEKNKIFSNQIHEKIQFRSRKYEKTPQVTRIKSTSPKISRVQLNPLRSRIIYPTEEDLKRRQERSRSYKKGEIRVISSSPRRQVISPPRTPIQSYVQSSHTCNCSQNCSGRTCIHIHGCCTISCEPNRINIHSSNNCSNSSPNTSHLQNNTHISCSSCNNNNNNNQHQHQYQHQHEATYRINSPSRHQIQKQYNMDARIDYMNKLQEVYKIKRI